MTSVTFDASLLSTHATEITVKVIDQEIVSVKWRTWILIKTIVQTALTLFRQIQFHVFEPNSHHCHKILSHYCPANLHSYAYKPVFFCTFTWHLDILPHYCPVHTSTRIKSMGNASADSHHMTSLPFTLLHSAICSE